MKKIFTFLILCCSGLLAAQSYQVGDLYIAPDSSRGVVFYVHPDGSGGWVVALNDASDGCPWGLEGDIPGLTNLHPTYISNYCYLNLQVDTSGYAYTQAIRNYQNNDPTYAAGLVDFANGWYLPSYAQLLLLYGQMPFIANALIEAGGAALANGYYWSSSERDASSAWQLTNQGGFEYMGKTNSYRVRAIRSFSYETPPQELSYLWNTGATTPDITVSPSQTTTYTVTVTTPGGCTDTLSYTVVVNTVYHTNMFVTRCDEYEWNSHVYTEDGDYEQTFTAANGCDSVVTLHLTLTGSPEVSVVAVTDVICEGDSVTLQAQSGITPSMVHVVSAAAVGDILCTDNTIVKPANWPMEGKTAMGVVFYVDPSGMHGWAAHLADQATTVKWGGYGSTISTMTAYSTALSAASDLNGYANTLAIRAAGDTTEYPAAWTVDVANGWYMPAAGQLQLLMSEYATINSTLAIIGGTQFDSGYYWPSTQYNANQAWSTYPGGNLHATAKNQQSNNRVRSIRDF